MKKIYAGLLVISLILSLCSCVDYPGLTEQDKNPVVSSAGSPTDEPSGTAGVPDIVISGSPMPTALETTVPEPSPATQNTDGPLQQETPEPTPVATPVPTEAETPAPTVLITSEPTQQPTQAPTQQPTPEPTKQPTPAPTSPGTPEPIPVGSAVPTPAPTASPEPSEAATPVPSPAATPEPIPETEPDEEVTMSLDNLDQGVVGISYNYATDDRLAIRIAYDTTDQWYYPEDRITYYYPLQLGNGTYKIQVCKEINDSGRFAVIFSEKVELNLSDDKLVYKASITEIFWTEEMAAIVFAYDRTKDASYEWEMVVRLYEYIVERYRYDYEKINTITGIYIPSVEVIFYDEKLICYDYSVLFASMLRSLDIPAKLVKGFCDNADGYHAWNEIYNPETGRWVLVDATFDAWYYDKGMKYSMEKDPDTYYPKHEY